MRGSRVQAVVNELQGEKIDIIQWNSDPATFIVNALAPAEVTKVVLDEDQRRIEVVVPDEQLSLAIGRRGQNVRLASNLTGWEIDIMTEGQESERRVEEFRVASQDFIEQLNVDDVIAHLLVTEGFADVEAVAFVPVEELGKVEGFDETLAAELRQRARNYLVERDEKLSGERRELGVSDEVASMEGLSPASAVLLGKAGVKSLDDLADLAGDELQEIVGEDELSIDEANGVIMAARAHWFDDDADPEGGEQLSVDPSGGQASMGNQERDASEDSAAVLVARDDGDDATVVKPEAEEDKSAAD
jgi:N utilization substance protein A